LDNKEKARRLAGLSVRQRLGDKLAAYLYAAGEGNGPPDDCGGIPGFYELLEAIADPTHPSHAHLKEWVGDYDPATFDVLPIKFALGRIANRRNAAKRGLAKKKHFGSAA
jgi:hypothetical protein